jgi:hypothetical protein
MTWGTTHHNLAIKSARCEVVPIRAEAHTLDDEVVGSVIDKHTGASMVSRSEEDGREKWVNGDEQK